MAICTETGQTDLFELGDHNSDKFETNLKGISCAAKKIIEYLINNYDSRPKRIRQPKKI